MTTVQALVQACQTNQALALAKDTRGVTQNQRAESLFAVAVALTSAGDEEQAAAALVDEAFAQVRISWHEETRNTLTACCVSCSHITPTCSEHGCRARGSSASWRKNSPQSKAGEDGNSATHVTADGWRVPFRQT